jgi:hypothetical protein
MRRAASDRALGIMTRPAVHRRSELFGICVGTRFNGLPVLSGRAIAPRQYRLIRVGLRPCAGRHGRLCSHFSGWPG